MSREGDKCVETTVGVSQEPSEVPRGLLGDPQESVEFPHKSLEVPHESSRFPTGSSEAPPDSYNVLLNSVENSSTFSEVTLDPSKVLQESFEDPPGSSKLPSESYAVSPKLLEDPVKSYNSEAITKPPEVSTGASEVPPGSSQTVDLTNKAPKRKRRKRRHSPSFVESERLEKLARKEIEKAMTAVVVRKCWSCKTRFIKDQGCNTVMCVCGSMTCYRCGERILGNDHRCQRVLPSPSMRHIREAAENVKQHLRLIHPGLTFKYDPSRKRRRRKPNRKN